MNSYHNSFYKMPNTDKNGCSNRMLRIVSHGQICPHHMHRHHTQGFNGSKDVNWNELTCRNVVIRICSR